jgi:integrase/recombinase XerD
MNALQHILAFKNYLNYRRYSQNTVKTYSDALEVFFRFFNDRPPEIINIDDLIQFNTEYILKKNLSASYQNQVINAIKLVLQKSL